MLHLAVLANATNYHMRRWLPALASRGIHISLLSFVEPIAPLPDIDFHQLERPTRSLARHNLADFLLATGATRKALNRLAPDVVMGSYATNYGFLGARTGLHPFVLQTWTADVQLYPSVGWKRFVLGPIVRHAMRSADLITTDGPALRDTVLGAFPNCSGKTESILWGVEIEEFVNLSRNRSGARARLNLPDDAVVVTTARGLRFHDRPEISLPALLDVLHSRENVHGVVLTLGHLPSTKIVGVLDALRAHPRGHVIDRFLDREGVNDVWAASDFVVSVPLFDGISESLLEAMAVGCLPILSDIPPNRIIVPDPENAIFSPANSAESLKMRILTGVDTMDRMKESAVPANRAWVRQHASIDQAADRLAELLTELAGKGQ